MNSSPAFRRSALLVVVLVCSLLSACAGVTVRPTVRERVEQISERHLRTHVETLESFGHRTTYDVRATEQTVEYLVSELRTLGYRTWTEPFTVTLPRMTVRENPDGSVGVEFDNAAEVTRVNVVAERPGECCPDDVIEVGAHYDSVLMSPGADDNASGVAGVLEIARVLVRAPTERTVRFVLFGMEENGLVGSEAHVAAFADRPHERIVAFVNLEMIGTAVHEDDSQSAPVNIPILGLPSRGDFIAVLGHNDSGWLGQYYEDVADAYVPDLRYYSMNRLAGLFSDSYRSDHAPYWRSGRPAIMLTDTANFRTPHYHKPTDRSEHLDFTFMRQVTQAAAATVMHLAGVRAR